MPLYYHDLYPCRAVNRDFRDPAKADIKRQREEYVVRSIQRLADPSLYLMFWTSPQPRKTLFDALILS
jgi:hypothetical protein